MVVQSSLETEPEGHTAVGLLIGVLAGAGVTVSIMQYVVVPIIPALPRLLGTSEANASWAITSTLLVAAVSVPIVGRLGDMFGKRRMILLCTSCVVVGSVVCGLTSSLVFVVIGRSLHGFGLGLVSLGLSLMRDVLPEDGLPTGVAWMSSSLGVGGALGLPLAAAIAELWGWHSLFWTTAVLSATFGILIRVLVPETTVRVPGRIDWVGLVGLAGGTTAILLAITNGGEWGWSSTPILILFPFGASVLAAWVMWERRADSPIVDLCEMVKRPVLATNLATFGLCLAMYSNNLLTPRLLQLPPETGYGLGYSLLRASIWMVPGGLALIAFSQVAARLTVRFGARGTLLTGIAMVGAGNLAAPLVVGSLWGTICFSLAVSIGVAFSFSAMPTLIMSAIDPSQTAAANGFNAMARYIATASASAIIGAILGQGTVIVGGTAFPSLAAIRLSMGLAAVAAVLAVALGAWIPRGHDVSRGPSALP